jgi:nicotinate-nucleotide adenylyltransferase
MAKAALRQLSLDEVLFIPTGAPRYRKPPVASAAHRLAMLRLALQGAPRFRVDERELAPEATGYTVDTLAALRAEQPEVELTLLIGADQHAKFEQWHRPREIERLAEIAVFSRPGVARETKRVRYVPMEPMPVSASEIRARVARGEDVSAMVPAAVASYIARHRLYS